MQHFHCMLQGLYLSAIWNSHSVKIDKILSLLNISKLIGMMSSQLCPLVLTCPTIPVMALEGRFFFYHVHNYNISALRSSSSPFHTLDNNMQGAHVPLLLLAWAWGYSPLTSGQHPIPQDPEESTYQPITHPITGRDSTFLGNQDASKRRTTRWIWHYHCYLNSNFN